VTHSSTFCTELLRAALDQAEDLTRFLKSQIGDASEAQDLMKELYIRILRLRPRETIRSPKAYLFRIAVNLAYQHRLRRSTTPPVVSLEGWPSELHGSLYQGAEVTTPEVAVAIAEEVEALDQRMRELSPKVRAAILWHHHEGYTCEEIGAKLSVVTHRVKKYLVKGLSHCRGERIAAEVSS
jgi:RNA polymerase sigma-70 factor (ECF subfamily)